MKKNNKPEGEIIFDKLKKIFDQHGAANTFFAMLEEIKEQNFEDLNNEQIIDILFRRSKFNRSYLFLEDSDIQDVIWNLDSYNNFKVFKVENLAQEIRFDEFLQGIEDNPCQLKLIA